MSIRIRHQIHYAALNALLRSPAGGVARDMLRRGIRVQSQAKRNLGGGHGRPRRIDSGLLRSTIFVRPTVSRGLPAVWVGSDLRYARWVHDGTGLYGPRHQKITPRRAKVLRFRPKGSRRYVYVRSVKGMKPNPFLADALKAAKG